MNKKTRKETIQLPPDTVKNVIAIMELVAAAFQPLREAGMMIVKAMERMQPHFLQVMEKMTPALQALAETVKALPERTRRELRVLGEHGWYMDFDMPVTGIIGVVDALEEGNVAEAEEALVQYYQERTEGIENTLVEKFPARAAPIQQAFKAHKRGEFFLSVPVFLVQSDGICKELTGLYLFVRRDRAPETAKYVKSIEDELTSSLLYPLSIPLPISASERERESWPDSFNRHEILHGVSSDYGTEVHSLKAISLLNYIVGVLTWNANA